MTIVVVGGGPTGVELAGSFAELTRTVLKRDFRRIDPTQARIILLEASPNLLSHFPPDLSASARRQLEALGVQVRTGTAVNAIRAKEVELASGEIIPAANIIWAAGVSASPLTKLLGVDLDRAGRIKVNPDLSLPGRPEIFAIGDLALVRQADGSTVPGVSPAAIQMAISVAKIIRQEIISAGNPPARAAFKYWDKGTMATIGRSAAVAWIGRLTFFRTAGVAGVAVHPFDFPDRLSQPHVCFFTMDLFLSLLQTQRPLNHPPAARRRHTMSPWPS